MSEGFVIGMDPAELERFPAPEPEPEEEQPEDEADEQGQERDELLRGYLERIPKREADLLFLYFIARKKQHELAAVFGVTQAAISYRIARGLQRIKFLRSVPAIDEDMIRRDLTEPLKRRGRYLKPTDADLDVEILVGMWRTTCQSVVAGQLQITQGRVRHRFFKCVRVLKEMAALNSKYTPYASFFAALIDGKKFNIGRAISLPQWASRGVNTVG